MEAHAGIGRVDLQIERRCLDGLLLLSRQTGEAVGKRVGDAEIHDVVEPVIPADYVFQSAPGMIRCINSSNSGTVNAVSP